MTDLSARVRSVMLGCKVNGDLTTCYEYYSTNVATIIVCFIDV
jgi:hypothetical protein